MKHPIDNKRLLRNRWSFGCFRLKVRWLNDGNFQARDGGISKIIQKSKYFFFCERKWMDQRLVSRTFGVLYPGKLLQ